MKTNPKTYLLFFVFVVPLIYIGCNGLVVDNSLSPPTIGEPIYSCSDVIAFGGADRDAIIRVYVNGSHVKDVNTWMGWGTIKLPSQLSAGNVVSAAQIIGNHISVETREPVTVGFVPPEKIIDGDKLMVPKIIPPLYECQKAIMVKNVVHGATVHLVENDVEIKDASSPYNNIRFWMPELKYNDKYEVRQEICQKHGGYKSDHSAKEYVQNKPTFLPTPEIHEPIVEGNDACRVDNLLFGATVEIFAVDANGETQVGGGTALSSATIFHINPPFDMNFTYYAKQSLCELGSDPSDNIPPVKEIPAPVVQEPVCNETFYVTVCNTVVLSTVKVFVNGTPVAQAAGNGDCVKMAIGDFTLFSTGQKVEAQQYVSGVASPMSDPVTVQQDGAPPFNPGYWNDPYIVECNNCYNYGCNIRTDTYAQPGKAHNVTHSTTCSTVGIAAQADGLEATNIDKKCDGCTHLVALVIAPGVAGDPTYLRDYHWYRLDNNGRWSHKPGPTPAKDTDESGSLITDPETADRRIVGPDYIIDYSTFCGYYCVDRSKVEIKGSKSCN